MSYPSESSWYSSWTCAIWVVREKISYIVTPLSLRLVPNSQGHRMMAIYKARWNYRIHHGQNKVSHLSLDVVREVLLSHVLVEVGIDEDCCLDSNSRLTANVEASFVADHLVDTWRMSRLPRHTFNEMKFLTCVRRSCPPRHRFDAEELVGRQDNNSSLRKELLRKVTKNFSVKSLPHRDKD